MSYLEDLAVAMPIFCAFILGKIDQVLIHTWYGWVNTIVGIGLLVFIQQALIENRQHNKNETETKNNKR